MQSSCGWDVRLRYWKWWCFLANVHINRVKRWDFRKPIRNGFSHFFDLWLFSIRIVFRVSEDKIKNAVKSISRRPYDKFRSVFGILDASATDQTVRFTNKTNRPIVNHHYGPGDAIRLNSNWITILVYVYPRDRPRHFCRHFNICSV